MKTRSSRFGKQYFNEDQLKRELWKLISSVKDMEVLQDLNITFSDKLNDFNDKRSRFEAKISNLTAMVGISLSVIIAITIYILNMKILQLRFDMMIYFLGLVLLLTTFVYLILISKPKDNYYEIKELSLVELGMKSYGDYLREKIFDYSFLSVLNSFSLEVFKNKYRKIYYAVAIAYTITIFSGALIIIGCP